VHALNGAEPIDDLVGADGGVPTCDNLENVSAEGGQADIALHALPLRARYQYGETSLMIVITCGENTRAAHHPIRHIARSRNVIL
jgi:hypothetical protein